MEDHKKPNENGKGRPNVSPHRKNGAIDKGVRSTGWGPVSGVLLLATFVGMVCWLIIAELGWMTGSAVIVLAPAVVVSIMRELRCRWRRVGDYDVFKSP